MPLSEVDFLRLASDAFVKETKCTEFDAIIKAVNMLNFIKNREAVDAIFLDAGCCPACLVMGQLLEDPDYEQVICLNCGEGYLDIWEHGINYDEPEGNTQ